MRSGARGRWILKAGATAAVALALIWLSISVGISSIARDVNPGLALSWAPFDARAQGNRAYELIQADPSAEQLAAANRLASEALFRDPMAVPAARSLGLIADLNAQDAKAGRLFAYSERLSNRDLPTRLWLIQDAVDREDAVAALRHFDIALRTSRLARPILFPVLIAATEDGRLIPPLADLLATGPRWRADFIHLLISRGQSSANIAALVATLGDRQEVAKILDRLLRERDYDNAWSVYERIEGGNPAVVRNGGFEQPNQFPPFDWALVSSGDLSVGRRAGDGEADGMVLSFSGGGGARAEIVRQLIALQPGRYKLSFTSGGMEDGGTRPLWIVSCASDQEESLVRAILPSGSSGPAPEETSFSVPEQACPWQWLSLEWPGTTGSDAVRGWVDEVSIEAA